MPIVFVHGTSVRPITLYPLLEQVNLGLAKVGFLETAVAYSYGASAASLRYGGMTIPGLSREEVTKQREAFEDSPALPSLKECLYGEPLIDLKVLSQDGVELSTLSQFDPRRAALRDRNELLNGYREELARHLHISFPESDLPAGWIGSVVNEVLDWAQKSRLDMDTKQLKPPITRALTAWIGAEFVRLGRPIGWGMIEPEVDEAVQKTFGRELGGFGILRQPALWLLTHLLRTNRGNYMPAVVAFLGDILYYLSNRDEILDGLHAVVLPLLDAESEKPAPELTLICHSLGGIIAMDYCVKFGTPVHRFVTAGCQVGLFAEADALYERHPDERRPPDGRQRAKMEADGRRAIPKNIEKWLNIYDLNDMLSFRATPVFSGVEDKPVDLAAPFPDAHGAYWTNEQVYDLIRAQGLS